MKAKNNMNKRAYFAFPYAVISVVFVVIPLFFILWYAFTDKNGAFTLKNFLMLDGDKWYTMAQSFAMAFLTTLICLLLSYPLALALIRIKTKHTAFLVLLFIMPMWINSLLRLFAVKLLFENVITSDFAFVLIGMVYDFFPFMLLPIYTILVNTDKSVIEASSDLGASPLQTLIKVRLPLSVPGIISGCLMVFMPTISTFAVSEILTSRSLPMFGNLINDWFEGDRAGYGYGAVYALVLMILIALFVFGATKLSKGKASASQMGGTV